MADADLPRIRSLLLASFPHVAFGMSTRQSGASDAPLGFNLGYGLADDDARVTENMTRFSALVGLEPEHLAFMRQVHGDTVRVVTEPGVYDETDALITREPGIGLVARVADCAPIALYSPAAAAAAVVHAGWRGTAAHIARKTVELLRTECGAEPPGIYAFIGPCAGACCYEVGEDVAALFPGEVILRDGERGARRLDLRAANLAQLIAAGIPVENIEIDPLCTIHERAVLHSWRRDGEASGRMLACITLREAE
jgi:polyphenol oxidase